MYDCEYQSLDLCLEVQGSWFKVQSLGLEVSGLNNKIDQCI